MWHLKKKKKNWNIVKNIVIIPINIGILVIFMYSDKPIKKADNIVSTDKLSFGYRFKR